MTDMNFFVKLLIKDFIEALKNKSYRIFKKIKRRKFHDDQDEPEGRS